MSAIDAVLFDFGSTLFAHEPLAATVHGACRRLGAPASMEWAERLAGRIEAAAHTDSELLHPRDLDADVWSTRWRLLYAAADDEVTGLGAAVFDAMHDPQQWTAYAGTAAVLHDLAAAEVRVGVVSNTGWDIRAVFRAHSLEHLVRTFVLSYEVGVVKPAVEIFLAACQQLDVAPEATLMVGDDPVADAGAVRAGLRTLLLPARAPGAANGVDAVARIVRAD